LLHDATILKAVKQRLDTCHLRAEAIVQLNCPAVVSISLALREAGYLDRATILQLLKEHNLDVLSDVS
jgi:hypothetical protein